MNPQHFMAYIQTGDVLCFEGTWWYSWIIKLWTLTRYSHAALVVKIRGPVHDRWFVAEALEGKGVRLIRIEKLIDECRRAGVRVHWFTIVDPAVDRNQVADYALSRLGDEYVSLWQMLFSFGRLTRWLLRKCGCHHPVELDPERFFCSEYVASALEAGGFKPEADQEISPVTTDPGTIPELTCLRPMGVLTF